MKKLDKLILSSFIGPFILTFLVVVFILLTQHMLKYFDDIIGKGLGMDVIGQLLFYFAIFMTPIAMPLAVLLSALIAYGNLGEHFELTAVKSAGISLVRTLVPIFFFVLGLTALAFYVNNNLVPKAALEAYSLLYDIKQKKPALDLREGSFYDGIPNMNIKVNKKFPDGITIKDVIIYDHRKHDGNRDVTVADSGKMYTILNERYLKFELFNGYNYSEGSSTEQEMAGRKKFGSVGQTSTFSRTEFSKTQVVFDLSSFELSRTDKKWFQGNRIMRNLSELQSDMDSIDREVTRAKGLHQINRRAFFSYLELPVPSGLPEDIAFPSIQGNWSPSVTPQTATEAPVADSVQIASITKPDTARSATVQKKRVVLDSTEMKTRMLDESSLFARQNKRKARLEAIRKAEAEKEKQRESKVKEAEKLKPLTDSAKWARFDSIVYRKSDRAIFEAASSKARSAKNQIQSTNSNLDDYATDYKVFRIQWHKIIASSLACIAMFLIGAPLGAIIKKGGLGVPFLVSILFFIIYYLLTMTGEKWAKQGLIPVPVGVWAADVILFVIGLIFLRQARLDARLFEADFYLVVFDKVKKWLVQKRILSESAS